MNQENTIVIENQANATAIENKGNKTIAESLESTAIIDQQDDAVSLSGLPIGYKITKNVTYGYIVDPDHPDQLIIDKDAEIYIRFMFDEFFRGASSHEISARLTNIGAPCSRNSKVARNMVEYDNRTLDYWNPSNVRKMLCHEIYTGKLACVRRGRTPLDPEFASRGSSVYPEPALDTGSKLIANHHEPYITDEQHDYIINRLSQEYHRAKPNPTRNNIDTLYFQSRIFCKHCYRSMRFYNGARKKDTSTGYYMCSSIYYHIADACPPVHHFMSDITPTVHEQLLTEVRLAKDITAKRQQGINCPDYIAYDSILKEEVDRYVNRIYKADPEDPSLPLLRDNLTALICERRNTQEAFFHRNKWLELFSEVPDEFTMTRELATHCIDKVFVDLDGSIEVIFKDQNFKKNLLHYFNPDNARAFVAALPEIST